MNYTEIINIYTSFPSLFDFKVEIYHSLELLNCMSYLS
jgi:hypothetical protein